MTSESADHSKCRSTEPFTRGRQILCGDCGCVIGTVKARPRKFTMSEDAECAQFVRWLELQRSRGVQEFTHIANETPTNVVQAARLKRLGVRKGVPDYLLVVKHQIVFIEMKRAHGGRVSPEQQRWLDVLRMAGASTRVCEGFHEAKQVVSNLLDAVT